MNKSKSGQSLLDKAKAKIFFERQDGALCGQHCLNNALQSRLFSPVELSEIAKQLDQKERQAMAERGTNTQENKQFIKKPSANFDDSGYFSVQVLSEAFKNMDLELVSVNSNDARAINARKNFLDERLLICHMEEHWFAMRKFGQQWVNLNSTLRGPELMTDTYFNMLLATLQQQGGRLFAVFGELPACEADGAFCILRRTDDGGYLDQSTGHRLGDSGDGDRSEAALMERAIRLSLAKSPAEDVRAKRAVFLSRFETKSPPTATQSASAPASSNPSSTTMNGVKSSSDRKSAGK